MAFQLRQALHKKAVVGYVLRFTGYVDLVCFIVPANVQWSQRRQTEQMEGKAAAKNTCRYINRGPSARSTGCTATAPKLFRRIYVLFIEIECRQVAFIIFTSDSFQWNGKTEQRPKSAGRAKWLM